MLKHALRQYIGDRQRRAIKAKVNETRQRLIRTFLRYDGDALRRKLRAMGVASDDTLLVHSNFEPNSGFAGTPLDLANVLVDAVGHDGNLLMMSIPFRGTAYDYLAAAKPFNVKKTFSMMGLVTEMFRRREGTCRSLHPTHPVLACGRDAAEITSGHNTCLYPCGPGTPFEKFHRLNGKILFFDVGFEAITFFHYVEHLLKDRLPFPVYDERLFTVPVIDGSGQPHTVRTYAFSRDVTRRADKLREAMRRGGRIRTARIGNSRLILVSAEDVVACQTAMVEAGDYPYDFSSVVKTGAVRS
jgi:aminoglycoside 3-N-acetyltransferase